jgi:hypothetical protein
VAAVAHDPLPVTPLKNCTLSPFGSAKTTVDAHQLLVDVRRVRAKRLRYSNARSILTPSGFSGGSLHYAAQAAVSSLLKNREVCGFLRFLFGQLAICGVAFGDSARRADGLSDGLHPYAAINFGMRIRLYAMRLSRKSAATLAMPRRFVFTHRAVLLAPAENAFDHRPAALRHGIAAVPGRAAVDGAFPMLAVLVTLLVFRRDVDGAKVRHMTWHRPCLGPCHRPCLGPL